MENDLASTLEEPAVIARSCRYCGQGMEKGVRALVDPDDDTPLHRSINYERRLHRIIRVIS